VDPSLVNNFTIESAANSYYNGLIVQVNRRFGQRWALNAHYTFSNAIDEVDDWHVDYTPNDQLNARADRGLSPFNQKHRFVLSAVWQGPVLDGGWFQKRVLSSWTASPIISANSARPFNALTGYDNVGDGQTNTHRPAGAGRNIGIGPNYFSTDFRLARAFKWSREASRSVTLSAEVFNALNYTNFSTINNIVGTLPLSALPHPLVGHRGNPTDPLAFTAAFDPRQFQFGLIFTF